MTGIDVMPLVNRYSGIIRGAMTLIGNSLVLKNGSTTGPGSSSYTGVAYLCANSAQTAGAGYIGNTTAWGISAPGSQTPASSSAILNIPTGSTIVFAQLAWVIGQNGGNPPPNPNRAITLQTPAGPQVVPPTLFDDGAYPTLWRAADVTNMIQSSGGGTYTVSGVPAFDPFSNGNQFTGNGWELMVVYENSTLPLRYFDVNTGSAFVSSGTPSSFTFTQFQTPPVAPITAYLLVSEVFGDLEDAAYILVGSSAADAVKIGNPQAVPAAWNGIAPYAPQNNILPGSILHADTNNPSNIGLLDTTGTLGAYNNDPFLGVGMPYARINLDIAGFNISDTIRPNQNSLFTRVTFNGTGNANIINQSVQVDVAVPIITANKSIDKSVAQVGDTLKYTITYTNTGTLDVNNGLIVDTAPNATSFIDGTVYINSVNYPLLTPASIPIGTLTAGGGTVTVEFEVAVDAVPNVNPIVNTANLFGSFDLVGETFDLGPIETNGAQTTIIQPPLTTEKDVDLFNAEVSDILTYSLILSNQGNEPATNIVITDALAPELAYLVGSITSTAAIVGDPTSTITVVNPILPGNTVTITFKATITALPPERVIENLFVTAYDYTPAGGTTIPITTESNPVYTTVSVSGDPLAVSKSTTKKIAKVGDVFAYTLNLSNTGVIAADHITVTDALAPELSYVPGSITSTAPITGDPDTMITVVNSILPGATVTISFNVAIVSYPPTGFLENLWVDYDYTPTVGTIVPVTIVTDVVTTKIFEASRGVLFI